MSSALWVIDDDAEQARGLVDVLRESGFSVLAFHSVLSLRSRLRTLKRPDAVLMDLALAGSCNGFELAAELVHRHGIPAARFVFMTGWFREYESLRAKEFSRNRVLSKADWTVESLLDAVAQAACATAAPQDDR